MSIHIYIEMKIECDICKLAGRVMEAIDLIPDDSNMNYMKWRDLQTWLENCECDCECGCDDDDVNCYCFCECCDCEDKRDCDCSCECRERDYIQMCV